MRRKIFWPAVIVVTFLVSCVTINIYFPAEEVRNAADKIVNEIYGEQEAEGKGPPETDKPNQPEPSPQGFLRKLLGPGVAHAGQDIDVSTPEIRAIKEGMKKRADELIPYFKSGHVGIGTDGLLEIRTSDGLALKDRGRLNRLLADENRDRLQLYKEIARANGLPGQEGQVQEVFADSWRSQAAPGWYLKQPDGQWTQRP